MSELELSRGALRARHGSNIGQPMTRRDGIAKVTGSATFAGDNHPPGMLHAVIAGSSIANGRLVSLDVAAAKAHRGVIEVMTVENHLPYAQDPAGPVSSAGFKLDVLQSSVIRYANQPIAVVIAETLEAATEGVTLLSPRYEVEAAVTELADGRASGTSLFGPDQSLGDVEAGFAAAATYVEGVFDTPAQYHNPMEPHTIVARWEDDGRLIVDTPHQGPGDAAIMLAKIFGLSAEDVHVRSQFLGGGFGSKGFIAGAHVLCVSAARMTGRPVKLVLRRNQMFGMVGHRGKAQQKIRLGVDADGHLLAVDHHVTTSTSVFDDFVETGAKISHALYASPAIRTAHECVRLHIGTPTYTRAPGEATGSAGLEIAIDEAAYASGIDPLEFRLRNYAEVEPISGKPFSSKALRECYAAGAERFGWAARKLEPRQTRDETGALVGWGLGTATFPSYMSTAEARAILRADGTAIMETSSIDMGQGSSTALAQIAADSFGLPIDKLEFRSGHSGLPNSGTVGGSTLTAGGGSAIHDAGSDAIAKLARIATADEQSPLYGASNEGVVARAGRLHRRDDDARSEGYIEIMARAGLSEIEGKGRGGPDEETRAKYAMHAHGAVFAEVRVDPDLGQIRVTRVVGAYAAGRIINPRLVRSQFHGGMIWGISYALHEGAITDRRSGRIMNADFAGYHVPVNADIVSLEVLTVEEHDPYVNPLGVKGIGELAITGVAGAIANAVWHATDIRVRRYPISLRDLVDAR